ncbi:Golgi resident protein GCP60 [Anopheles arabiensis]|uniref:AGAP003185-PA n=4 Tax=gambiae species complex TaxID=44542 RepID=Q7QBG2_ANOGA|nr:Golgi resident protein GCP60 [Anopheles arabiensis]XP_312883.4 Golgi resident protein GCP60 [Anopheles gambiae]EAA08384.4 AGAP003185-PA [Anopheles gambiae str. PEST]
MDSTAQQKATMIGGDNLELSFKDLSLDAGTVGEDSSKILKWNLPLKELYKLACSFYKEKSGKAIHLSYEDNLKLVAFTQQAAHGPLDLSKAPPLGMFDVIGKDRRIAWQQLGTITKLQAMEGFIDLLDRLCPLFKPYVEAIKKDREEKARRAEQEEIQRTEALAAERERQEELARLESEKNREELHRRQLQDALNQQTYHQFKEYAEIQFPGNPEQQAVLIRQLQNEHYHQYMQQLQAQVATNLARLKSLSDGEEDDTPTAVVCENGAAGAIEPAAANEFANANNAKENSQFEFKEQCDSDNDSGDYAVISPANMWTKPDIKLFKQEVMAGKGDGVIRVNHGDTVTVKVPTHEGGSCLFWEFATDSYDIGFGVYFEWGKPPTTEVSVHISESDEDDDTIEEDDEVICAEDLECGQVQSSQMSSAGSALGSRNPISIIIPIYRRECHQEVYAGSHTYPGEGTYLLKFDNSYSLWRPKTLYYKVFYTR